ncbi:DUF5723 family protein [Limibacter armeniacum]|uniref:DUF5723 family protein n=1 Tax=Limibacter armeniacum TaxID=466084 RepID=UPI002FE6AAC4
MRRLLLLSQLLLGALVSHAQMAGSVFSAEGRGGVGTTMVTDYHSIGINPANLGVKKDFRDPDYVVGLMEFSASLSSKGLTRGDLWSAIVGGNKLSSSDKEAALLKLSNASIALNLDVTLLGASMVLPKNYGGVAFSIKDNVKARFQMNPYMAEFALFGAESSYFSHLMLNTGEIIDNPRYHGEPGVDEETRQLINKGMLPESEAKTFNELLDGMVMTMTWYREYNVAYGAKLLDRYNFSLYSGVGFRYIQGLMVMDMRVNQQGNFDPVFSSAFVDSDQIQVGTEVSADAGLDNRSLTNKWAFPDPVGRGFGVDVGLTMLIGKNLRVGASVNNWGSFKWTGDVFRTNLDAPMTELYGQGFDNYNMSDSEGGIYLAGERSLLEWTIEEQEKNVELPWTVRFGASYELYKLFHVGFDVILPQNEVPGSLADPLYGLGGDFQLNKIIKLSSGVSWGGNGGTLVHIPAGITLTNRKNWFEVGVSTRDIRTWLFSLDQGNTISLSGGFLRVKL